MKRIFLYLPALICLGIFNSCADDDVNDDPIDKYETIGRYHVYIDEHQDTLRLQMTDITDDVERIESTIDWLDFKQEGKSENGFPLLYVMRAHPTPTEFTTDSIFVYFSKTKRATVVVDATGLSIMSKKNSDEYKKFNEEWWKHQTINYYENRSTAHEKPLIVLELPWASSAISHIPDFIYVNDALSKDNGWEMAYNMFMAETCKPYFMLYNKYTGILRVFYCQVEQPGQGGEFSFSVIPATQDSQCYPFYHGVQYAIPASFKDLGQKGYFLDDIRGEYTFSQRITPYLYGNKGALSKGWYCFDIDMSAYHPNGPETLMGSSELHIACNSHNTSDIYLSGAFTGEGQGSYTEKVSTSTSKGLNTPDLKSFINKMMPGAMKIKDCVTSIIAGKYTAALTAGATSIYNFYNAFTKPEAQKPEQPSTNGSFSLSFSGKIDLKGYIDGLSSNNAIPVKFKFKDFALNENTGKGVWSLQNTPTVYVVNDRLYGDDDFFTCQVKKNGYFFGSTDPENQNFRIMSFLDPRTIKFNINPRLFNDIRDINVAWSYGVYPNQNDEHTNPYRNHLLNVKLDSVEFIDKSKYEGQEYRSLTNPDIAKMKYVVRSLEDTRTDGQIYSQKGSNFKYYSNNPIDLPSDDPNFFIHDPVVLLPTTFKDDQGYMYDFKHPDFIVCVILTFTYNDNAGNERLAIFTQRFIPEVRGINYDKMIQMKDELKDFVNSPHQTIESGGKQINIGHKEADKHMKNFFHEVEVLQNE